MSQFKLFSKAVNKRLNEIAKNAAEIYRVDIPDAFEKYLSFFPEGSNPIFRERTEHDCNCCKQFIRNLGLVVTIKDNKLLSVWGDLGELPHPYNEVAKAMDELVTGSSIFSIYRTVETRFGLESNTDKDGIIWDHFYGYTPSRSVCRSPGTDIGQAASSYSVLMRGLNEIQTDHIEEILDLIKENSIYRGAEQEKSIKGFKKLKKEFDESSNKELFVWSNVNSPFARFRNTAIGTLFTDRASGVGLDDAVHSFEKKLDPTRYKRTTSLITKSMVESAVKTLKELDLEDSVNRRFASVSDISVNDIIYIDNNVINKTKDGSGIADLLSGSVKTAKVVKPKEEVSIEEFLALKPSKIEVILEREHLGNFVSLTAPNTPDTPSLFKWDNSFGWSYDGNVTDSIKEKVKAAGGNVDAKLRCSLAWFNGDDLDIHCHTPKNNHIYYGNKVGVLDVDMNAGGSTNSVDPVENLSWNTISNGVYKISVNMFSKRSHVRPGFKLQVEFDGKMYDFTHKNDLTGRVDCLELHVENGKLVDIKTISPNVKGGGEISVEKWGVQTMKPLRVNMVMLSPNHWENSNKSGNKHYFFMLDGCMNPEPTRGIYNEFLASPLEKHRKVFEVLGSKTMCQPSNDQLSGIGFSTTQPACVKMVADGRPYTVKF